MKDLEELGRLRDLGLLNDEEFETARQEIFSRRPNATNPAKDDDVDPEESEGSVEEGEVTSPSELDIVTGNDETTTDSADNWWRASDGQWYPPEALASVKEQGWFQDNDGQWYPPSQAGTEEESSVSVEHATESSSEREIDPEPSDTQAPVEKQNREENDQKQDWPGVRPLPIAPRSPKSPDSETVNFSQPKNSDRSPGRKKLLIATTAAVIVIVGIVTVIARSNTTLPTTLEPVRTAVLSSTFGPWEDAQSAFIVRSRGAKKWQALTGAYRAYFERGSFSEKSQMGVSRQDDWYVIEYCSVGACEDGTNVFELHLHMGVSDRIDDLRWFRGTKGSLEEAIFYEVQLDPDYLWDDPVTASEIENVFIRPGLDFDYAIQDRDEGCLIGKSITPGLFKADQLDNDLFDRFLLKRWWIYLRLNALLRTRDGLELESSNGTHPSTLEVSKMGEDDLLFCTDYEIAEAIEFVVPEGNWESEHEDDNYYHYLDDFVVPFRLVEL